MYIIWWSVIILKGKKDENIQYNAYHTEWVVVEFYSNFWINSCFEMRVYAEKLGTGIA